MPRIPRAAKQLFSEIAAVVPDAGYDPVDDPDGFGVHRTFFVTGKDVARILEAVSIDKRIKDVSGNVVEFVTTVNADTSDIFNVARAQKVIGEAEPTLEERLNAMTKAQIAEEYGFESGTKKDMIAEVLADQEES
jgi:hypothetical protein